MTQKVHIPTSTRFIHVCSLIPKFYSPDFSYDAIIWEGTLGIRLTSSEATYMSLLGVAVAMISRVKWSM